MLKQSFIILFYVQGFQGPQGLPGPVGRRGVQVSQTFYHYTKVGYTFA